MNEKIYDIAVIGGGPGGYHSAIRAAQYDAKVVLIERDKLGGTCVNRGCIPKKALYAAAKFMEDIRKKASEFGMIFSDFKADFSKAVKHKNAVVNNMIEGIDILLKQRKIDIIKGHGRILGGSITQGFSIKVDGKDEKQIIAKRVIIATGSTPKAFPGFDVDHKRILTSDNVLSPNFDTIPKSLIIIGGGAIGCEFAHIFSEYGSKVKILEYLPTILATQEPLIVKELKKKFNEMEIEIIENVNVLSIKNQGSKVEIMACDANVPPDKVDEAEKKYFHSEMCVISIGRKGVYEDIGLDNTKVKAEHGRIFVNPKTLMTTEEGIYAIGDVTGGLMLAHVAYYEGDVAVFNALCSIGGFDVEPMEADYSVVPISIFTSPIIGSVGFRMDTLKKMNRKIRTGRFTYAALGAAQCVSEKEGFLMINADAQTGEILGAACLGSCSPQLISEVAVAMKGGLKAEHITRLIHSHPTLSEIVLEAAEDVYGLSVHRTRSRIK